MRSKLKLAYLTTCYPGLSHTFILREVAALRRLGADVHTISMRRTSGEHLLSPENRAASQSTYTIRPIHWRDLIGGHLRALVCHTRAYLTALREALRLARPGLKGWLWQLFYFGEAILVWRSCSIAEARHLHAHHGSAPADVALLAAHFGKAAGRAPTTWSLTVHGPTELSDVGRFGLAEKVRLADAVICISDFARSQLMALVDDRHWAKLQVVHCGVRPLEYQQLNKPSAARAQLLCVGRLVPEKGHAVLLDAVALLVGEGLDVEAVLVGSGPLRGRLERRAAELELADRVVFRGALGQQDVRRCYATASVFCLASFAEGVPVVLMEAMAAGCPVIAPAISGVRELVRDRDTGLLVTPGRADELASALRELLCDPRLRERVARAGLEHVRREFDVDRSAAHLQAHFSAILEPANRVQELDLRSRPARVRSNGFHGPAGSALADARLNGDSSSITNAV